MATYDITLECLVPCYVTIRVEEDCEGDARVLGREIVTCFNAGITIPNVAVPPETEWDADLTSPSSWSIESVSDAF